MQLETAERPAPQQTGQHADADVDGCDGGADAPDGCDDEENMVLYS